MARRIQPPLAILALTTILTPLAILATVYLYLYPVFHGCAFPLGGGHDGFTHTLKSHVPGLPGLPGFASSTSKDTSKDGEAAPIRLLVLADPQLEGDSSLPSAGFLERLSWAFDETSTSENATLVQKSRDRGLAVWGELVRSTQVARKILDLLGNDYYLAHIYRTLYWWTRPSHVTVLGDLIGSQWVSDAEFDARGDRFWKRVFRGGEVVTEDFLAAAGTGTGDTDWSRKIINIAGNHDIGYSGDISDARIERFERVFGPANWDVTFPGITSGSGTNTRDDDTASTGAGGIHLINLNSLTLDSPALSSSIQTTSYNYINDVLKRSPPVEDSSSFTLLLTHLPLHKEDGICVDGPYIAYHDVDDPSGRFEEGGLREQNHLSEYLSATAVLQGVFGMSGDVNAAAGGRGRNGLILNGHDHEGCDVVHYVAPAEDAEDEDTAGDESGGGGGGGGGRRRRRNWTWKAARYNGTMPHKPSIREVTLRSMMGEFGGNAGLLSLWFDADADGDGGEWKYEIQKCAAGVQHIWWAVHVVDVVVLVGWGVFLLAMQLKQVAKQSAEQAVSQESASQQSKQEVKQSEPVAQKSEAKQSEIQPEKSEKPEKPEEKQ